MACFPRRQAVFLERLDATGTIVRGEGGILVRTVHSRNHFPNAYYRTVAVRTGVNPQHLRDGIPCVKEAVRVLPIGCALAPDGETRFSLG